VKALEHQLGLTALQLLLAGLLVTPLRRWAGVNLLRFRRAIGLLAFNQIIKWTSAIVASSVTYMIPIVALGWGFMDGEAIYFLQVISMFILLAGIYLVNKAKN
jgi:DMSO/TMAO reductase YedYZ heme-binding membrane subunit